MGMLSLFILIGAILVVLGLLVLLFAKQYKKVGPNEILIISGGKKRIHIAADGTKSKIGYRYRGGGGTFVFPFIETVDTLPMEVLTLNIRTPEVLTAGGVPLIADAAGQIKIDSSDQAIHLAAEQFLGIGKEGIREVTESILEGKMREVIGTMTVEEIYKGRHEFSKQVNQAAQADFSRMGLVMISFALKDIRDTQGYLEALGKPRIAAAKRDASIAEAETEKDAVIKSSAARKEGEIARLAAEALIAKAQWENEAKKSESQILVNEKKAKADYAYELERSRLNQEIKKEESKVKLIETQEAIKIEELEISRKEKELNATVLKPADARKYQIRAEAEAEEFRIQTEAKGRAEAIKFEGQAEAEKIKQKGLAEAETMLKKAQAWEKYNQAAILENYFQILPELAKSIAEPLSKVDKIVIIGSDKSLGTTKITAQVGEVLAQLPDVVKSITGVDLNKYLKNKLNPEKNKDKE